MNLARDLADRFHQRWLEANPFVASMYGLPGYDDLVPDESEEAAQAWRAEVARFGREADAIAPGSLTPADAVTLDCTREAAEQELAMIDMARVEYTVTAMQYAGPPSLLAVAARTVLLDETAAEAYLIRLRRSGAWLDQISERLRAGASKGRLPVAPLTEQAITWAEGVLAAPVPEPLLAPRPPRGGTGPRRGRPNGVRSPRRWSSQRWSAGWPPSASCYRGRGRPGRPGWSTCRAVRKTTPGRSGAIRPCRCNPKNCTRPGWTTSPP